MSKRSNEDKPWEDQSDLPPVQNDVPEGNAGENNPGVPGANTNADSTSAPGKNTNADKTGTVKTDVLTIEEHRKNLNVDAPVFQAIMTAQKWASGKKVPEAVFIEAVESFLGSPMGGK